MIEPSSKKNLTNSSNLSKSKLNSINISHPESDIIKSGKSFKISRRNINVSPQNHPTTKLALSGLVSLSPLQKNNNEFRKSNEMRLNEIKMSYSQTKRHNNRHENEESSIDAKLRRLRRDHQPKLNLDDISKYENRGREFENSLQMNIDFLLNLKRDGFSKDRLIKR
jgi:hypothetical protein